MMIVAGSLSPVVIGFTAEQANFTAAFTGLFVATVVATAVLGGLLLRTGRTAT
jgi:hypothetical protein